MLKTNPKSQIRSPKFLDDAAFLHALQVSDSFFPTGMVTFSHALETFVDEGEIKTAEDFECLLEDYLCDQIGVTDAVALANAHQAAGREDLEVIMEIDRMLTAMKLVKEARESSTRSGRRMLVVGARLSSTPIIKKLTGAVEKNQTPGNYAVAMGVMTAAVDIPCRQAMLMQLYSFAVSFLGAAVRLGRLNYLEVQEILQRTGATIVRVVDENIDKTIHEMRSFAPAIDIMGMKHQRAEKRLFIS